MTDQGERSSQTSGKWGQQRTGVGSWIASFLLIVVTLSLGIASVILLASTLTQTRIASLSIEGVSLSIWKLEHIRRDWADIRKQVRTRSGELIKLQIERTKLGSDVAAADTQYTNTRQNVLSLLEQLNYRIRPIDPELAKSMSGQSIPEQMGRVNAAHKKLRQEHPELGPEIDQLLKAHAAHEPTIARRTSVRATHDTLARNIKDLEDWNRGSQNALDTLYMSIKADLDENARSRIENALYELQSMDGRVGSIINRLVVSQPDILTLSLVILMGILGSSLQMTHAYFKGQAPQKIGGYFLRLSVGAMTALVIFIVAKAGVPVIADASRLGGDAPINPYFVSFIAIISGLLSENAIANIQSQGARIFGGAGGNIDRWTRQDVSSDLASQNLTLAGLATHLGHDETTVEKMLKGEEKIGSTDQQLIALALRRSPRELYTDVAPA